MKLFRACRASLVNTLRDDLEIFGDNGEHAHYICLV